MILEQMGCHKHGQPLCIYVAGAGGKTSWIHFLDDSDYLYKRKTGGPGMILEQMGCHKHGQPLCIYVAGAGGKTSWIHFLADQERKKKKKVLILTSTHIYEPECFGSVREENGCQTLCQKKQWADEILSRLETWGVVIAGIRCGNGKITWVGDEVYERIKKGADRIFVEADGSRHLPIKVPSSKEPVVFSDADLIFVTEGMPRACRLWESLSGRCAIGRKRR